MSVSSRLLVLVVAVVLTACGDTGSQNSASQPSAAQLSKNAYARVTVGDYVGAVAVAGTLETRYPHSPEAAALASNLNDFKTKAAAQRAAALAAADSELAETAASTNAKLVADTHKAHLASETRFEGCRTKLKKAHELDVLYDLKWKSGQTPRVLVGPTFYSIPIDAKQGFASTVNCFLTAGKDSYINFEVMDWRSGKAVGEYRYGQFSML
jgi:hypothetical protein